MLWEDVVGRLDDRFRCVVPDLPLGAHSTSPGPDTDLSPTGVSRLVEELLDALDLRDVVLVGNDTGGALCQLLLARSPERLAGLVLTNCDAFERFPPPLLRPFLLARTPRRARALGGLLRPQPARRALLKVLTRRPYDRELAERWLGPLAHDPSVARDVAALLASVSPAETLAAARHFATFDLPMLLVWGEADRLVFPVRLAERLAAAFPRADVLRIPRADLRTVGRPRRARHGGGRLRACGETSVTGGPIRSPERTFPRRRSRSAAGARGRPSSGPPSTCSPRRATTARR
jgi:pimeloyl-ACP methyl ester carboxylesterase